MPRRSLLSFVLGSLSAVSTRHIFSSLDKAVTKAAAHKTGQRAALIHGRTFPFRRETRGGRRLTPPPTHLIPFVSRTYAIYPCDDTEACCYLQQGWWRRGVIDCCVSGFCHVEAYFSLPGRSKSTRIGHYLLWCSHAHKNT